ncbi:MAG: hypothetical protein JXR43_03485, partial [Burkholderiaceae bacterium]|nr:hypothetical protein [Burkholderiaceae bacterium]
MLTTAAEPIYYRDDPGFDSADFPDALALPMQQETPPATVATNATPQLQALPVTEAIARAQAMLLPQTEGTDAPYPLEALGPLASAARDLSEGAQVSPAMAG